MQKIFAFGKISLVFLFLLLTSVVDASEVGKMEVKEDGNVIPNGDNGNIVDLDVVQSKPRILVSSISMYNYLNVLMTSSANSKL